MKIKSFFLSSLMLATASLSALPGGGLASYSQERDIESDQEAFAHQREQAEAERHRTADQETQGASLIERSNNCSDGFKEGDGSNQMPLPETTDVFSANTSREEVSFSQLEDSIVRLSAGAVDDRTEAEDFYHTPRLHYITPIAKRTSQDWNEAYKKEGADSESVYLFVEEDRSSQWSQENNNYSSSPDCSEEEAKAHQDSTTRLKPLATNPEKMIVLLENNGEALIPYRIAAANNRYQDLPLKKISNQSFCVQIIPVAEGEVMDHATTAKDFYKCMKLRYDAYITASAFLDWSSPDNTNLLAQACRSGLTQKIILQVLRQADFKASQVERSSY